MALKQPWILPWAALGALAIAALVWFALRRRRPPAALPLANTDLLTSLPEYVHAIWRHRLMTVLYAAAAAYRTVISRCRQIAWTYSGRLVSRSVLANGSAAGGLRRRSANHTSAAIARAPRAAHGRIHGCFSAIGPPPPWPLRRQAGWVAPGQARTRRGRAAGRRVSPEPAPGRGSRGQTGSSATWSPPTRHR